MNLRVLIADDEPLARARIRRLLERDACVSIVDEARNGAEAVRLIERHRPDLVFLDVQMPKTDGFAVVEQVGADTMPPGLSPRLFAKGIVSTRQGGYGTIVFSPDHRDAFWKPNGPHLLFMTSEGGVWSAPRVFPSAARPAIDVPFFSPDGRRLYFMAVTSGAEEKVGNEEIWFVERTGGGWSEPRSFDPVVNSVPMHWQFSMDAHGHVYLSTDGGVACARFENGRYRAPEKLPAPVNQPHTPEEKYRAGEVGPFISPKGDYLIFTKFGAGVGLWITFAQRDGGWGEPLNLSERLGGTGNDSAAQVTPDGKYLFFQSVRPGSAPSRSFYWVDTKVIESLRPVVR